ncbi:hypothetical protein LZ30DRAFT_47074 [Colletotrichum cereale]|nr:hypothetical protein LZ30DRAFT_47074 [Colletotrichum cereale]
MLGRIRETVSVESGKGTVQSDLAHAFPYRLLLAGLDLGNRLASRLLTDCRRHVCFSSSDWAVRCLPTASPANHAGHTYTVCPGRGKPARCWIWPARIRQSSPDQLSNRHRAYQVQAVGSLAARARPRFARGGPRPTAQRSGITTPSIWGPANGRMPGLPPACWHQTPPVRRCRSLRHRGEQAMPSSPFIFCHR